MGLIESMAITNAMSGVIPFGSPTGLFIAMISLLAAAAIGILLSVPPRQRQVRVLRVVRAAPAGVGLNS